MTASFWFSSLWKARSPEDVLQQHLIKLDDSVGEELGRGAYGAVCEVKYNGATCVAKRVLEILTGLGAHQHVGRDQYQHLLDKFKAECDLLSKLRHPNVVQFIGICQPTDDPRHLTLVMEKLYINLDELIKSGAYKPLDEGIKLQILLDVSAGLIHIHSHGVIHRDLNAGNVLLTRELRAKIADFGMSRLLPSNAPLVRLDMTMMPGAPDFMPPEAMTGSYDMKLDTFSFGHLTLYLMLEEYPAPRNYSTYEIRNMKAEEQIEIKKRSQWLEKINHHMLYELVVDCLKDEPKDRPTINNINKILTEYIGSESKDYLALLKNKLGQYQTTVTAITDMIRQLDLPVSDASSLEINDLKRQLEECKQQEVRTKLEKDTKIATRDREIEMLNTQLTQIRMELTEQSERLARDNSIMLEKDNNIAKLVKDMSVLQEMNSHYQQDAAELNQQILVSTEQKKELEGVISAIQLQNQEKAHRITGLEAENRELKNKIKLLEGEVSQVSKRASDSEKNHEITLELKENLEEELHETREKLMNLKLEITGLKHSTPSFVPTPQVQYSTNNTMEPMEIPSTKEVASYDNYKINPAQPLSYVAPTEFTVAKSQEDTNNFIPDTIGYYASTDPNTQANDPITTEFVQRRHTVSYAATDHCALVGFQQTKEPMIGTHDRSNRFSYVAPYYDDDEDMPLSSLQVKLKKRLQKMEEPTPSQPPTISTENQRKTPPPIVSRKAKGETFPRNFRNKSNAGGIDESSDELQKKLQRRREKFEQ